jgi:UDP-N-acetylglucosamine--N-acetylmuramyl-(pentapeptide) pyrophosphoryl-undecaprenol N-acetylglucosamine transferase
VNRPFARSISAPATSESKTGGCVPAPRRVAIAGGYTAGHVNTGLEIAREYQSAFGPTSILFIGTRDGFESRLVPPTGHRLEMISGGPIINQGHLGKLNGAWSACVGVVQARRLLKAERIELMIGLGSYVSALTLLAARQLGIRTALHEANEQPGFANRFASRFVDRIYLGSHSALADLGGDANASTMTGTSAAQRVIVTGNPVREEILGCSRRAPLRDSKEPARILVTGGSLGSAFLNRRVPELLGRLAAGGIELDVHHQAGDTDLEAIRAHYDRVGLEATVASYFDAIAEEYGQAHFAITSAGAITLAELAACGLPSLVVPLAGAAHDHQVPNAAAYSRHCGALWSRESDWNPAELAAAIARQLENPAVWNEHSKRAHEYSRSQAARELVEDCESMMRTHR